MWRFKLHHLLSTAPEYLAAAPQGKPPTRGKYLRLSLLGNTPCALGRVMYEAKDSFVYELIALREGYNAVMIEICKHPPGSVLYEGWYRHITEQSESAREKGHSLFIEHLADGSTVKVTPYQSRTPQTDWHSRLPVTEIERLVREKDVSGAAEMCRRMMEQYGPKGILLEEMARLRRAQGDLQEARHLFERSVKAHREEGNASILAALLELAVTLLDLHEAEPQPKAIELDLGDGIRHRQIITPIDTESPTEPADLSDVALEVLVEALFVEPHFSSALLVLCDMLGGGWEAEAFGRVAKGFLSIDPFHPSARAIKERLSRLTLPTEDTEDAPADAPAPPAEMPPHVAEMLRAFDAAYEPPIPEDVISAESLVCASQYYVQRSDIKRAERDLRRALELSPRSGNAAAALADLWCYQNKWEEARDWLLEQKREFDDEWRIYEVLGRISSQLGAQKESCIYFHRALALGTRDSSILKARLGNSYRRLGNEELARTYLNEAYGESPKKPLISLFLLQFLKARMLSLSESGGGVSLEAELQEANRILNAADQNGIITGEMLFIKAQMLMILKRLQEALQALRAALDRDPYHPQAAAAIHAIEESLESRKSDSAKQA